MLVQQPEDVKRLQVLSDISGKT